MTYTSRYASPLGDIILACDEDALIGLWFNGQKYCGSTLPAGTQEQERPLLREAKEWLDIYFSGRQPDFLPPLRYDATPFRKAVCDIMRTIPYGQTMTYGEIAARMARQRGLEKMSAQAVGGAVGRNPHFPHDPLPPRGRHKRQPDRVRRRHPAQGEAAGAGARRYDRPFRPEKGHRPVMPASPENG